MECYPKTLDEFERQFCTEEACRDYLFGLRWPEGFYCPQCQQRKAWQVRKSLWECATCGIQTSVTAGTIFQGTRQPLTKWFRAIWWVTSQENGASALGLQRVLGLGSYETAWTWLHPWLGLGVIASLESLKLMKHMLGGGKPGKRGRGAAGKALVVIMAQQDGNRIGRVRLCRVPDASGRSLENVIQQCVEQGSEIMTDGWSGYNGLGPQEYNHKVIRDLADGGNNLLPSCHRMASLLKRWLLGTHQGAVSHEHLDYYLDEYTFRFNRRTSQYRGKLFYRLLQQAVTIGPSPYKQMIKQSRSLKPQHIVGT